MTKESEPRKQGVQRIPHPHAELIKAWADGAVIQVFILSLDSWVLCTDPVWCPATKYRIKPEDVSKFAGLYKSNDGYRHTSGVYSLKELITVECPTDAEFSLENKLELVFDGETKKLKNVVIHGKD